MQVSKATTEQARAARETQIAASEVSKLAAAITKATTEQTQAAGLLAKEGDEVRRIAKQGARALNEQSDALAALSGAAVKHTGAVRKMSSATTEQAAGSQQISAAVTEIRMRARDLIGTLGGQSRSAADMVRNVRLIATELAALELGGTAQVDALTEVISALLQLHEAKPAPALEAGAAKPA
jgi:methyl-accepting chemotaxis protein